MMKIGVLTSSRADYGIYQPLLRKLENDPYFNLSILAFGTHLLPEYGETIQQIKADGYSSILEIPSSMAGDAPSDIAASMGNYIIAFSQFWKHNEFDVVFALGDRFEMFAACTASIPFNIRIAHIHGGETTTGSIDNVFRNAITHMAFLHFTVADPFADRVIELKGSNQGVYNTGALSIENIKNTKIYSTDQFKEKFDIDLTIPSILITYHPETVNYKSNVQHIQEIIHALQQVPNKQQIITMPNADTAGLMIRKEWKSYARYNANIKLVESFGLTGYLSCMHYCDYLLGNSSSVFYEATYMHKRVINIGDRQKGRLMTPNIMQCKIQADAIVKAIQSIENIQIPEFTNPYGTGNTSNEIISILKSL